MLSSLQLAWGIQEKTVPAQCLGKQPNPYASWEMAVSDITMGCSWHYSLLDAFLMLCPGSFCQLLSGHFKQTWQAYSRSVESQQGAPWAWWRMPLMLTQETEESWVWPQHELHGKNGAEGEKNSHGEKSNIKVNIPASCPVLYLSGPSRFCFSWTLDLHSLLIYILAQPLPPGHLPEPSWLI